MGFTRFLIFSTLTLVLAGCSAGGVPPVSDRSRSSNVARAPGDYVVVTGDTLYSIAWRHQQDFRTLAALNRIRKPYDIYPGQRLRVRGTAPARSGPTSTPVRRPTQAKPKPNAVASAPHPLSRTQTKPQNQTREGQQAVRRSERVQTTAPPQNAQRPAKAPTIQDKTIAQVAGSGPVTLRWPSSGTRVRNFGDRAPGAQKPSRSIDFLLKPGASIRSSAAGEVVYVGQGLAGFEQFVIVKHNDTWLSAYGFNAPSVVREKQLLAPGTVLATLTSGAYAESDGARRRQLHFELRKNGTPVNPATVIN